jgi:hypothetical protein
MGRRGSFLGYLHHTVSHASYRSLDVDVSNTIVNHHIYASDLIKLKQPPLHTLQQTPICLLHPAKVWMLCGIGGFL